MNEDDEGVPRLRLMTSDTREGDGSVSRQQGSRCNTEASESSRRAGRVVLKRALKGFLCGMTQPLSKRCNPSSSTICPESEREEREARRVLTQETELLRTHSKSG